MDPLRVFLAGPYNGFYVAGLVVAFTLASWQAWRRGWPLLPWLALLAACVAGGIVGSKLLHFDLHVAAPGEKTILGGVAGGMLALLIVQRWLRFPGASFGVLAPAVLLGAALGRVGCFLAGCCFGRSTSLPWGVRYAAGTRPFDTQVAEGLISPEAVASLPVHPTQLYEAALAALLALILWRWGDRLRSAGGAALALVVGFGAARFAVEFYRAGATEQLHYGLKVVQWTVALVVVTAAATLLWREVEARLAAPITRPPAAPPQPERALAVIAVVLGLAVLGSDWFTPLEISALLATTLPGVALLLRRLVERIGPPGAPGVATATLLLVPLAPDTIPGYPRSYFTVGGSMSRGAYEIVSESCGYVSVEEHEYGVWGVSGSYTQEQSPQKSYSIRAQAYNGENRLVRVNGNSSQRQEMPIQGGALSGTMRFPLTAGSLGVTAGFTAGEWVAGGEPGSGIRPVVGVRAGASPGWFADLRLNQHEPAPYPRAGLRLGGGYEFSPLGSQVQAGLSDAGLFLNGSHVSAGGTEIEPFFGFVPRGDWNLGIAVRQRIGSGARSARP